MASPDLILFAIRSALKLSAQARAAYVDATRSRAINLPLPNFNSNPNVFDAVEYFKNDGKKHLNESAVLLGLKNKFEETNMVSDIVNGLTEDQKKDLVALHNDFVMLDMIEKGFDFGQPEDYATNAELASILKIRQWREGNDPNPTLLRRFAGTFIEIGVDYFVNYPGAVNKDTRSGRAVYAFFSSFEEIEFSKELSKERIGDLPGRLLIATLETVSENTQLFSGDPKFQKLIGITSNALVTDVAQRIQKIRDETGGAGNEDREARVKAWAELVFRSVLASGGQYVASNPKEYLGIDDPVKSELVSRVGAAALGFVLEQPEGHLDKAFGREGLEVVIKAGLSSIGRHPELVLNTENVGLKNLLSEVATKLGQNERILDTGILPELTRMILEKTGENLYLFWPDWAAQPEKHLLLTAAGKSIEILTQVPSGAKWKPQFTNDDLLAVTEAVFNEFAHSPGWLIDKAGKANENLGIALGAMVDVLREKGDLRLNTHDAAEILIAGLEAVALRQEFITSLIGGTPLIGASIDVVLGALFRDEDDGASWALLQSHVITGTVEVALEVLSNSGLTEAEIQILERFMKSQVDAINQGKAWSLDIFEAGLRAAME